MKFIDRLGLGQRIIAVITLGLACAAIGMWAEGSASPADTGWFGYAPLTRATQLVQTTQPGWEWFVVWLALIVVWGAISMLLLRRTGPGHPQA